MLSVKGIVVCVNYDDLLQITLPRNLRFLTECVVVTSPGDIRTQEYVKQFPNCKLHITDSFFKHGAVFNKGLAMEEGFDVLGRSGWILVWDADTLFPDNLVLGDDLRVGKLYGCPRIIMWDPKGEFKEGIRFWEWPYNGTGHLDKMFPGYFHLFHASDPKFSQYPAPWYDVCYKHAGGGDGYFQSRWSYRLGEKVILPFRVLHLGPHDQNWFGRHTPRLDDGAVDPEAQARMHDFHRHKGWHVPPQLIIHDKNWSELIEVPGHVSREWVYQRGE